MPKQWMFFQTLGGSRWTLPIISSLNEMYKLGTVEPLPKEINDFFGSIYYRLTMLPRIIRRINIGWGEAIKIIKANYEPHHLFTIEAEGYALKFDDEIRYNLIIDIDSLFFELNTCCELITKLLHGLYNHFGVTLSVKDAGKEMSEILKTSGTDVSWFRLLDDHRNLFIHKLTPRLAVEVIDVDNFELLILKENIKIIDDESKYLNFRSLKSGLNPYR